MAAADMPGGTAPPSPLHSPAPPPFPFSGRLHPFWRGPLEDARVWQGPWEPARVSADVRGEDHGGSHVLCRKKVPKMAFYADPVGGQPGCEDAGKRGGTHAASSPPPASYRGATHGMSGLTTSIHTGTTPSEEHLERVLDCGGRRRPLLLEIKSATPMKTRYGVHPDSSAPGMVHRMMKATPSWRSSPAAAGDKERHTLKTRYGVHPDSSAPGMVHRMMKATPSRRSSPAAAGDKEFHTHEDQVRRAPRLVGPWDGTSDDEGDTVAAAAMANAQRPLRLTERRLSSRPTQGTTTIGRHLSSTPSSLSGSILDVCNICSTNSNQFMLEETL